VRQAEELCACAGCRAAPQPFGLAVRAKLGGPSKGKLGGDNYYRPVTFLAPSLGTGQRPSGLKPELRPLSCYAFANRWLLPSPLGGETLERTALCSLSSS